MFSFKRHSILASAFSPKLRRKICRLSLDAQMTYLALISFVNLDNPVCSQTTYQDLSEIRGVGLDIIAHHISEMIEKQIFFYQPKDPNTGRKGTLELETDGVPVQFEFSVYRDHEKRSATQFKDYGGRS